MMIILIIIISTFDFWNSCRRGVVSRVPAFQLVTPGSILCGVRNVKFYPSMHGTERVSFDCVLPCVVSGGGPNIVLTTHSGRPAFLYMPSVLVHSLLLPYRHLTHGNWACKFLGWKLVNIKVVLHLKRVKYETNSLKMKNHSESNCLWKYGWRTPNSRCDDPKLVSHRWSFEFASRSLHVGFVVDEKESG